MGLAGGQILLSDDMKELDDDRLHLALKLIPPYFKSAIPIDALFSSLPTLYSLETDCVLGRRILVAIINWEDEIESKLLVLNQILSKNFQFSKVLLFDWWNEELIGIITSEESFKIEIPAHGCRYLGVIPWNETEKIKSPLVLASTIHITQGCKEITEISCNSNELFLNIKLDGFHKGRIFILFPFDFELKSIDVPFKVKKTSWGDLYSFSVSFVNDLQWKINFTKIL